MFRAFPVVATLLALASCSLLAEEAEIQVPTPDILPFKVVIDGNEAVKDDSLEIVAVVHDPIPQDASIEVPEAEGMVIINSFAANKDGSLKEGSSAAAVIMIEKHGKGSLDQTIDGRKHEPGIYLLNIMADGRTARVLVEVK